MLQGNARCEGRAEAARRDREGKARHQEEDTMEGLYRQHKEHMYETKTAEEVRAAASRSHSPLSHPPPGPRHQMHRTVSDTNS
jgi:hypothetical protein